MRQQSDVEVPITKDLSLSWMRKEKNVAREKLRDGVMSKGVRKQNAKGSVGESP